VKPARRPRPQRRRRAPPGTAPGTVRIDPNAAPTRLRAMLFNAESLIEVDSPELALPPEGTTLWLNIDGLGDGALLARVAEVFGLHPLAMEDIVNVHQRPKAEDFGNRQFIVLRMPQPDAAGFQTEQVSLVLGKGFVLSFQERSGDVFDPVRQRLRNPERTIRARGADYLCYALLDAVIDACFPPIEALTERIEAMEDAAVFGATALTMSEIQEQKRQILTIRAAVSPLREVLIALMREDHPMVGDTARLYLRDCQDHVLQLNDALTSLREEVSGLVDILLSAQTHRTNEVMRILTLISTIFIPLTFVAGVYGMNFDTMPELQWRWGYPAVLGVMALIALGLLLWFRATGWLGRR
jgi:magnesium transporter